MFNKLNLNNPFKNSNKPPVSSPTTPTTTNFNNPIANADPFSNAPPPYSPSQSTQHGSHDTKDQKMDAYIHDIKNPVSGSSKGKQEDALMALKRHDVVFLIDDSPSMDGLWSSLNEALTYLVSHCLPYDDNGIELYFMNSEPVGICRSVQQVNDLFRLVRPHGCTPTGPRMDDILRPYLEKLEDYKRNIGPRPKPMMLLVLTDGKADDPITVEDLIVEMADRLNEGRWPNFQLGIQFVQLGHDRQASEWLKSLDDNIKKNNGVRDIVDTVSYPENLTGDFLLQILLGSINRHIDSLNSAGDESK